MNIYKNQMVKLKRIASEKLNQNIQYLKYRNRYKRELLNFYKPIYVNPQKIEYFVFPAFYKQKRNSVIKGGTWDQNVRDGSIRNYDTTNGRALFPIEEYDLYQAMYNHFKKGVKWEETEFYSIAQMKIKKGEFWHGCASKEDIQKQCHKIDELYSNIKNDGYIPAQEMGKHISREITVDIGRDGAIYMDDGRHRLFITKILDFKKIPVWVLVRHRLWQKIRSEFYNTNSDKKLVQYKNHPDIESIM